VKLARAAFLLLPAAGVLAIDPVPFDFHAVKYLVLVLVALAACAGAVAAGLFRWTELSLPLWVFTGVRGAELLRAPHDGRALRWFSLLLALTVAHHVVAAAAPRRWLARRLVPMLGGLGGAVALYAVLQLFSDARQAHAFFAHRNFAGAGLAMLLPYAFATRRWLAIPVLLGLLATGSRGGLLAAAAVVAFRAAARLPRFRWLFLGGLPALVLAAGLALGDTNTVKARLAWYEAAFELGMEKPPLGHGAGGFEREYPPIRPAGEWAISGGRRVHAVHNDYLEAWANGGLLGLLAMLFLIVAALRAARREEAVFLSWIAFLTAGLVDLPWRGPALLTIAAWSRPLAAAGAAAALLMLPDAARHWVADRSFGRYLATGEGLDRALRWEPRHPEALIERSRPEDLALLLEQRPHDPAAWFNRSLQVSDDEAIPMLRAVLDEHAPNDRRCRLRLARLLDRNGDAIGASAALADVLDEPYTDDLKALQARILREAGELDRAEHWLEKIAPARYTPAILREMLELELARLREGEWDAKRIEYLVRRLPPAEVQERIEAPLARAEAVAEKRPKPDVPRREGEPASEHLARVRDAMTKWRRALRLDTQPDFREAFLLAEALCRHRPTVARLRLKARAARGLGDVERAGHFSSQALFLEALAALADMDPVTARRKLERAELAYPDVASEPEVVVAVRLFAEANPRAVELARDVFAGREGLLRALER